MESTMNYGVFTPFLEDSNVKRIDYNGSNVWVTTETGKHYKPDVTVNKEFEEDFTNQVKTLSNENWDITNPILEVIVNNITIIIMHRCITSDNSVNIIIKKN